MRIGRRGIGGFGPVVRAIIPVEVFVVALFSQSNKIEHDAHMPFDGLGGGQRRGLRLNYGVQRTPCSDYGQRFSIVAVMLKATSVHVFDTPSGPMCRASQAV